MVRVLAVADEVIDSLTFGVGIDNAPDLILAAGDLPFDYLETLMTLCDAPCVYVPGNHDADLRGFRRSRTGWTRAGLPADFPGPAGAVNADGRTVRVAGLLIAGLGGSLRYNNGPNQYTETAQRLRSMKVGITAKLGGRRPDILLTHSPARGVGDRDDTAHRGFQCIHGLVDSLDPALLIHGHVHPYGTHPTDKIVGTMTVSMNVVGYCQFDIEPGERDFTIVRRRYGA
ncbi:MAG: metallophosphoesterase [Gordonia sp. (in: high G+C Gram-positive bacteria)]